jgi:hypothetical protein
VRRVPDQGWGSLRDELAADVRRVADRLAGMSAAQLAARPSPAEPGMPPYRTRAEAGRAAAQVMADAALAMEHVGHWVERRSLPELADLATADQVAVTGHDLLAAIDVVTPATEVWLDVSDGVPARGAVERAVRVLTDVRRRI